MTTTPLPECPTCRERMEPGFFADTLHHDRVGRARWVAGTPEKSFFDGLKIKGHRQLDTVTYRCPRCGWLISFAPDEKSVDS
jgi:hypothetical protein